MKNIHNDAGKLRDHLTIFANQQIDDGCGGYENNWVEQGKIWANIMPAKASVIVRAGLEEPLVTHDIDVRQPLNIMEGMRLVSAHPTRAFLVLTVSDPDETRRYLRCKCRLEVDL